MAESKNNLVTNGLSGKLGKNLVFVQRMGKTIVRQAPSKVTKQRSEVQQQHFNRFRLAVLYAKKALADSSIKEAYAKAAKPGQTAQNVAVADFLQSPHITHVNTSGYKGHTGDTIVINAIDDFGVVAVKVSILTGNDVVLEEGNAIQSANATEWVYTAVQDNPAVQGSRIIIQAFDLPDNMTEQAQMLT